MKILNLTTLHSNEPVTIFVAHITCLVDRDEGGTIIYMADTAEWTVHETREEILRRIFG
jgi:hypothetical protein